MAHCLDLRRINDLIPQTAPRTKPNAAARMWMDIPTVGSLEAAVWTTKSEKGHNSIAMPAMPSAIINHKRQSFIGYPALV